jgi:WD40 repeat protein
VFDVDFHPDGSLAATSSMDAMGRVWDLRSGKCVIVLAGHIKPVVSLRFAPDGCVGLETMFHYGRLLIWIVFLFSYHMATGSDDHTVLLSRCVIVVLLLFTKAD